MKPIYFRPGTFVERPCSKCVFYEIVNCDPQIRSMLISCDGGAYAPIEAHQGNYTFEPEDGAVLVGHVEDEQ